MSTIIIVRWCRLFWQPFRRNQSETKPDCFIQYFYRLACFCRKLLASCTLCMVLIIFFLIIFRVYTLFLIEALNLKGKFDVLFIVSSLAPLFITLIGFILFIACIFKTKAIDGDDDDTNDEYPYETKKIRFHELMK